MNKIYLLRAVGCANDPSPCLLASAPLTSKWYRGGGCLNQFLLTRDLEIGAAINELGVFHSVRFDGHSHVSSQCCYMGRLLWSRSTNPIHLLK